MTERGIEITRVFDAPRERVWKEWTEPERFADWFGGSAEVPLASVSMDVRPGGAWRLTMLAEHGQIDWHGEYRDAVLGVAFVVQKLTVGFEIRGFELGLTTTNIEPAARVGIAEAASGAGTAPAASTQDSQAI